MQSISDNETNLLRYAFRASPEASPAEFLPEIRKAQSSGASGLEMVLVRPPDIEGITFSAEVSADLVDWFRGPEYIVETIRGDTVIYNERISERTGIGFMRLVVEGDESLAAVTFNDPSVVSKARNILEQIYPELSDPAVPITLGMLSDIKILVIESTGDAIATEDLYFLPGLTRLDLLGKNQPLDPHFIGRMGEMTSLTINGFDLSDLDFLAYLPHLEMLDLSGSSFDSAALNLLENTGITTLILSHSSIDDLSGLSNIESLSYLNIDGTVVSDLSPLASISGLEHFSARGTDVVDLAPLGLHTALRALDLRDTPVQSIAPLTDLTALETLNLRGSAVSNLQNVWNLTSLMLIDLGDTVELVNIAPLEFAPVTNIDIRGSGVDWCSGDTILITDTVLSLGRSILFEPCTGPYTIDVYFVAAEGQTFPSSQLVDLQLDVSDEIGERTVGPLILNFGEFVEVQGVVSLTPRACQGGGWRFSPRTMVLESPPVGATVTFEVSRRQVVEGQMVDPDGNPLSDVTMIITNIANDTWIPDITNQDGRFVSDDYLTPTTLSITLAPGDWILSQDLLVETPFAFCSPIVLQPAPPPPPPSTSRIAFSRGNTIYTINPDGSNEQAVANTGTLRYPSLPRWAPDGASILFTGGGSGSYDQLRRVTLATGSITTVYSNSSRTVLDADQRVNGDIVFTARAIGGPVPANNPYLLYRISGGSGSANAFIHNTGRTWKIGPRYSADGTRIAFSAANGDNIFTLGNFSLFTINANGSSSSLSGSLGAGGSPAWDSTGDRIAYSRDNEIRIRDLTTNSFTTLATGFLPTWSPDDEWIAYVVGTDQIYKIRSDGTGDPVFIAEGRHPDWSPELP
ncbi:MAG: PD40 domain-containing protein [Opitutales bacterium]|nr:PD40 domain-containing protein [Opitutales bacterium]